MTQYTAYVVTECRLGHKEHLNNFDEINDYLERKKEHSKIIIRRDSTDAIRVLIRENGVWIKKEGDKPWYK